MKESISIFYCYTKIKNKLPTKIIANHVAYLTDIKMYLKND